MLSALPRRPYTASSQYEESFCLGQKRPKLDYHVEAISASCSPKRARLSPSKARSKRLLEQGNRTRGGMENYWIYNYRLRVASCNDHDDAYDLLMMVLIAIEDLTLIRMLE